MRKTKLIGAIYARYSSRDQHSIEDQVRVCQEWADEYGIHVPDEMVFADRAITGRSSRRCGLHSLLDAIRCGRVSTVIIFKTNRLFRKAYKSFQFVEEEIVERNLRCVFVTDRIDTDDRNHWRHLLHINGLVDEFILETTAHHVRAGQEGLLLQARVYGTIAFGFCGEVMEGVLAKGDRPARRLAIDPVTADWVRKVFVWYVTDRLSVAAIVRQLNSSNAPLPPRSQTGRWTRTAVDYLLRNQRYIGNWAYGRTEIIWSNKLNYARHVLREQPLREIRFEHLRLIDDVTWHACQRRLADAKHRGGRHSKDGDRRSRPMILNRLLVCAQHDVPLRVGGGHGKYMTCPACQESGERYLFTFLKRDLALELICNELAELLTSTSDVHTQVQGVVKAWLATMDQPDESEQAETRTAMNRLNSQIQFILGAPGETEQDRAENHRHLADLRRERAALLEQQARMQEIRARPRMMHRDEEITQAIDSIGAILRSAATAHDASEVAAVREIIELMTGGRIEVIQRGERASHKGWLSVRFNVSCALPVFRRLALTHGADQSHEVVIDLVTPTHADVQSEQVMALYRQNWLCCAIAHELKIRSARVTFLIQHWHKKRGLPVPDSRKRITDLPVKRLDPPLYHTIGEECHRLAAAGMNDSEIARRLRTTSLTVRHAILRYAELQGLPVPTVLARWTAKMARAVELLDQGVLFADIQAELGYTKRGLRLAMNKYLGQQDLKLPDMRSRRGNARSGQSAQHNERLRFDRLDRGDSAA